MDNLVTCNIFEDDKRINWTTETQLNGSVKLIVHWFGTEETPKLRNLK